MLSLGCERLPTQKKKKKKVLDHYLHHDLGMLPLLRCFFAHLLILQYPDHHQNLISSYLYYSEPVHKISSQSVHNFLSNVVHRQTNKQTDKQTERQTSFSSSDWLSRRVTFLTVTLWMLPGNGFEREANLRPLAYQSSSLTVTPSDLLLLSSRT